jgi:hypothetical protein
VSYNLKVDLKIPNNKFKANHKDRYKGEQILSIGLSTAWGAVQI